MSAGVSVRVTAARVLDVVLHRGRSLKATLAAALPALEDARDRALVEAIVLAALRGRERFDQAIGDWMAKPLASRDHELRALLHAGFAQLVLDVAPHAAVAATVDAARALGRPHQAGLVNALLRRAQREGLPQVGLDAGWPRWLAARMREDWPEHADAVFVASAEQPPMWLRVNRRAGERDAYLGRLRADGVEGEPDDTLVDAIRLSQALPVQQLPGFDDGAVSVQDGSAQAVADVLALRPGMRVLDACAAPGGKSAHLAEREPGIRLLALDVDARRVRRMQDTFARLQLAIASRVGDALQNNDWWDGEPFDAILVDAPCSATGIIRRQPDVLLHRRAADIDTLVMTQADMLDALWPLLASGGVLVYATCSILRAENAAQVQAFLARTRDAVLDPLDAAFGHDTGYGHQRLPGEGGMDGFFYARLRKA